MGVSGTRHSVVDPPTPDEAPNDEALADESLDDEALDDDEPADSGIAILDADTRGDIPVIDPDSPEPEINQTISQPARPVGAGQPGQTAAFGTGYGGNKTITAFSGQPRRVRELALDQRVRIWRLRALIMVVVGVVFSIVASWPVGLTLAVLAGIVDTVYRSRSMARVSAGSSPDRAQRHTRRQLARMRRVGYMTLHARPIPNSPEVIDHLVVGPTGVYAIDSEKWHKDLPIRTRNGKQLWHGPESKKPRLEHARWEAKQASDRLSSALGTEVVVRPAMAVYGPKVPWDIATIRDVDVFSGPRLRKYLQRRARMKDLPRLTNEEVQKIYDAAGAVLPGVAPARTVTPVG